MAMPAYNSGSEKHKIPFAILDPLKLLAMLFNYPFLSPKLFYALVHISGESIKPTVAIQTLLA